MLGLIGKPAIFLSKGRDITHPDLVGFFCNVLSVAQVWRNRQIVIAVSGVLKAPLFLGTDAVPLLELLYALFAHWNATASKPKG